MKRIHSIALLFGVLTLLPVACNKPSSPAQRQFPTPEVTVMEARAEPVPLMREAVGMLAPTRVAEVRARVAGIVLSRVYSEGTDVSQGQVLFQIDPAPLKADLQAEQATLAKAEADANNAALIAKRYRDLAAKGLLSTQDLDTALANERSTAAEVGEARANVERARLDLEYATVTAPIAGYAGRALVTEGALVGQGEATPLTTVEQIDPIFVNFSQPAGELEQLRQAADSDHAADGDQDEPKVEVLLPDGSPYPHPGVLDFSDMAVDPQTGVVPLRGVVPNPDHRLLPGMFVRLRLTLGHLENAFVLPQKAVQLDGEGAYVLVVDSDGKVIQRRVQTHGMTRTEWIVSGNLADKDQVITDGLQHVRPGAMARAVPAAPREPDTEPAGVSGAGH